MNGCFLCVPVQKQKRVIGISNVQERHTHDREDTYELLVVEGLVVVVKLLEGCLHLCFSGKVSSRFGEWDEEDHSESLSDL